MSVGQNKTTLLSQIRIIERRAQVDWECGCFTTLLSCEFGATCAILSTLKFAHRAQVERECGFFNTVMSVGQNLQCYSAKYTQIRAQGPNRKWECGFFNIVMSVGQKRAILLSQVYLT